MWPPKEPLVPEEASDRSPQESDRLLNLDEISSLQNHSMGQNHTDMN